MELCYATKLENWRLQYISGTRKKWVYLTEDEDARKWPLSDVEKFHLQIPIEDHIQMLKQPTTPLEAAMNGFRLLKRGQAPNGEFLGTCTDIMFLTPMYVIAFHILGFQIPELQRIEQIRYIFNCANPDDGGWGLAYGQESNVFTTALNYISLRLLGLDPDHPRMKKARQTLKSLGGALGASMWGKVWLCVLNVYEWSGMNSLPPEIWLLPEWLPFHPNKWYIFMREVYAPISYLYRARFKTPVTELILALRHEIYVEEYDNIDWSSQRNFISKSDNHIPTSPLKSAINAVVNMTLESCHIPFLNQYALDAIHQHLLWHVENTNYTSLISCCSALNMLVLAHAEGVESSNVQKQKDRVVEYLWMAPEGMHVTVSTSNPVWAGGFVGHMLFETGLYKLEENKDSIVRLLRLFDEEQMMENTKHYPEDYRQFRKGGWAFGTKDEGFLLFDCTAEALGVILRLSHTLSPENRIPEWRLRMAVDLLLGAQCKDGGCPSYEDQRTHRIIELLNPTQEFGDCMIEYSTPELTASAITALADFTDIYSYRAIDIKRYFRRAVTYYHASQSPSGGWAASWGICFTFGTFYSLRALSRISNGNYCNSECVRKACDFLLSKQRDDGGWGESHKSGKSKTYIQAETSMAQTAWATLALIYAKYPDKQPIKRAVERVLKGQQSDGSWPYEAVTGYALRTFAIRYPQYRFVFPIWMLAMAQEYLKGDVV